MLVMMAVVVAALACAGTAMAYPETSDPWAAEKTECFQCHGTSTVDGTANGTDRQGPHAGYTTTTTKCQACHSVHNAQVIGETVLLPYATVKDTCEACHDGTGGNGVYGTLRARGYTGTVYSHSVETTSVIPGGDPTTGGAAEYDFNGSADGSGAMTCIDCHSPHDASVVAAFTGDRWRNAADTSGFTSDRLLKKLPTSGTTPVDTYGSDWCASCHKGRLNTSELHNHPVDSGAGAFDYDDVQVVTGVGASTTTTGSLGQSNFGYVMPYPYTAGQQGHKPICQQCHEDARHVGDSIQGSIASSEVFAVTFADGYDNLNNPQYEDFPHESANEGMLIEVGDDLCLNCHDATQQLP